MLKEIGTPDRIPKFIARAKDKNDSYRLMGFGHRVYKNHDPRATVMKQSADEVLELMGIENNPILQVAIELERQALADRVRNHGRLPEAAAGDLRRGGAGDRPGSGEVSARFGAGNRRGNP